MLLHLPVCRSQSVFQAVRVESNTPHSRPRVSDWKNKEEESKPENVALQSKKSSRSRNLKPSNDNRIDKSSYAGISPVRAVVVVRLMRIEMGGAFSDVLNGDGEDRLDKEMEYVKRTLGFSIPSLRPENLKLVTEEVAGIVRWKKYLDYVISNVYDKDQNEFERMEPILKQVLRLGAYELLKLEVPAYAVVNEAVKLANAASRAGAGKLANALLRAVASHKEKNTLPVPEVTGNLRSQARALATIHSHPVWMVRRWTDRYGTEDTLKLMEWNNTRPFYALRANNATGTSRDDLIEQLTKLEQVSYVKSPLLKDFVRVTSGLQEVLRSGLIQQGRCTVQDESGGLVVELLDPQPGDLVIDCCAAPGGKSLYIASRLKGKGKVIAVDINKARLQLLKDSAKKAGVSEQVSVYNVDARDMIRGKTGLADRVLLDAPCSGLGVLSKRADLRWRRTLESFEELTKLQDELLDGACKMVRPGGVLVYSTCSIEPDENIDRITSFLARNQNFILEPLEREVPREMVSREGCFYSLPYTHGIDGAFAAKLRHKA
ncbi:uncharacterized protein LOC9638711 isoform X1 [Selaginella moellendorffii]|uniref:uncharacterized protein LOC9638711 isoform X1 n=1 Tax=Selaginella moellendorffii TaxID=88036 RepID=UPI000D1D124E|nr:uncharacterized protein LOC9638711 isoform X1 [Selaginella moellendorffii]|eukprot:XP_024523177.1 uncharacterized protein LOC9638711 isoform X1 [Selaginella moellendorffii]